MTDQQDSKISSNFITDALTPSRFSLDTGTLRPTTSQQHGYLILADYCKPFNKT